MLLLNKILKMLTYHVGYNAIYNSRYLPTIPKYLLAVFFGIYFVIKLYFTCVKLAFECCLLLPDILESMNIIHIHIILTYMLAIFLFCSCQLKVCCINIYLIYNVGYLPCTKKYTPYEEETQ